MLNVKLREQTTETVVLNVAAIRTPARLQDWHAPRLEPLDVVGGVAVLGLLVEDRLKAESLAATGLIPIDTSVLSQALPATALDAGPGSPALRAVAAWYAPQSEFTLAAQYQKPPPEMAVTTSLLLLLADKGQEVLGGLSLLPHVEKRFSFDVAVPAGWHVVSVNGANGQPLSFERYATAEGGAETVSPLPLRKEQGAKVVSPLPLGEGQSAKTVSPPPLGKRQAVSPLPLGEGQGVRASRARRRMPEHLLPKAPTALTLTLSQRERGLLCRRTHPRYRACRHPRGQRVQGKLPRRLTPPGWLAAVAVVVGRVSGVCRDRRPDAMKGPSPSTSATI